MQARVVPFSARLIFTLLLVQSVTGVAQVTWRRSYGGTGIDEARSVLECAMGGYLVAGTTGSFGSGSSDFYLLRLDGAGAPAWSQAYGGPQADACAGAIESDAGFIVAGTASDGPLGGYDFSVVGLDADGAELWQRSYGGADWDLCNGLIALPDGALLFGKSYSEAGPQGVGIAIRINMEGEQLWELRHPAMEESAYSGAALLGNGTVAIAGSIRNDDGSLDGLLLAVGLDGEIGWIATQGGDGDDWFESVVGDGAGKVVALGVSDSGSAMERIFVVAYGQEGQFAWEHRYGNTADAGGTAITTAHGQGFVLTGYNTLNAGNRDMIFTMLDADGWFQSGNNYGNGRPADGKAIARASDGGYIVAGWVDDVGPGPRAVYVVKCDAQGQTAGLGVEGFVDPLPVPEVARRQAISLAPNPAGSGDSIELIGDPTGPLHYAIQDLAGRVIVPRRRLQGRHLHLPPGITGPLLCVLEGPSFGRLAIPFIIADR
jgi:hypothetical protein